MEDPDQDRGAEPTRKSQAFTDDDLAAPVLGLAGEVDERHGMEGMATVSVVERRRRAGSVLYRLRDVGTYSGTAKTTPK